MRRLLGRPLLWAFVISVALHALLLFQAEIFLPDWTTANESIEVELAPLPPPSPKPAMQAKPSAKPKMPKRLEQTPAVKHETPPVSPVASSDIAPEASRSEQNELPVSSAQAVQDEAQPMPPLPEIPDEPVAVPTAPRHVEIEFHGVNGSKGMGKQLFERRDDKHYALTAEMSMPVFLFVPGKIEQHSEGLITAQGLQPLTFRQQITGSKLQQATFDWDKRSVLMDTGKGVNTAELPPGTQDMLSFMYQFMFVPPLEEMRLNVVTGKKLRTYVYTFEGEETLDTPMGKLHTLHIGRNNRDGDEKTELWLATEYRYLPVRIRRTEKDGASIDLAATRLSLTE